MKPIVDEVRKKYSDRVEFRILNVDQPEVENESQKYEVTAIPTFVFLDASGNKVDQVVGTMTKSEFETKIENLLTK